MQTPQMPPQIPPQMQPQANPQPDLARLITTLNGPDLQKLLGALQQNPNTAAMTQPQAAQHSPAQSRDLSALLSGINSQQPYPVQQQPHGQPQQGQYPAYGGYQQPQAPQFPPQGGQQQQQQQHVQNIMEQLAKWKQ
jgi:hypothetical protein